MAGGASKKTQPKQFQPPRGTRDFYPDQMAIRRYIESVWRKTSINHGFDEIEGPMFEHLDLYTHKSGPGIVSELFQVFSGKDEAEIASIRAGGGAPYALRPEFTPTLARMVAAKAAELPRPIKWFAIPQHFRAERPQRGRLREFLQWNVDFIGDESPAADLEVLSCSIAVLEGFGLTPQDVQIRFADREVAQAILLRFGISEDKLASWMTWIDTYERLDAQRRIHAAEAFGGTAEQVKMIEVLWSGFNPVVSGAAKHALLEKGREDLVDMIADDASQLVHERLRPSQRRMREFTELLLEHDLAPWCTMDLRIVRGLAYYTGTVFEIHEASGAERAIAGGGRYDNLIESFGGPPLPACGFGMGDVVLGNLLHDKGLLKEEHYLRDLRPHAFLIALDDNGVAVLPKLVATLRREHNLHVRHSYKSTRNLGKLLGEAGKARAHFAVILGKELAEKPPMAAVKNLDSGEQTLLALDVLGEMLRSTS